MSRYIFLFCLMFSMVFGFGSTWIQAKALLGQVLLERAWQQSLSSNEETKAWPWADTWPIAELSVPTLKESMIVLEGVSGEAMAFGPGRVASSSNTAANGVFVVGGHRDSHLSFAQHLKPDDEIVLHSSDGVKTRYSVQSTFVADSSKVKLTYSAQDHALILITCFPFNALQTGGSLRYVVIAQPREEIQIVSL